MKLFKSLLRLHLNNYFFFGILLLGLVLPLISWSINITNSPILNIITIIGISLLIYAFSLYWVFAVIAIIDKNRSEKMQQPIDERIDVKDYIASTKNLFTDKEVRNTIIRILITLAILTPPLLYIAEHYRKYMTPYIGFMIFSSILASIPKDIRERFKRWSDDTHKIASSKLGGTRKASKEEILTLIVIAGFAIVGLLMALFQYVLIPMFSK